MLQKKKKTHTHIHTHTQKNIIQIGHNFLIIQIEY